MQLLPQSWRRSIRSFLAASLCLGAPLGTWAADFTVTNTNDSGTGSLRAAIDQANLSAGVNNINFATSGVITLASPLSPIATNVSINGPGSGSLTVNGANGTRIFYVDSGTVNISGLTLANGLAHGGNGGDGSGGGGGGLGAGGAIFIASQANVTLQAVAFQSNHAAGGNGGIGSGSANAAGGGGGGLGGNGGTNGGGGGGLYGNGGTNGGGGGGQSGNGGSNGGGGGGQHGVGGDGNVLGGGGGGGQFGAGGANAGGGGGQFGAGGSNRGGGGGQFGNGGTGVGGGGGSNGNGGNTTGGGGGSVTNGGDGNPSAGGMGGVANGGNGAISGTGGNGGPNGGGGGGGSVNSFSPGNGGNGGTNGGGGAGTNSGGNGGTNGGGGSAAFFSQTSPVGFTGGSGGANGGGGGGVQSGGNGGPNGGGGGAAYLRGGNGGPNGGGGGTANTVAQGDGGNGGANGGGGGAAVPQDGSGNSAGVGGAGGVNGGGGGGYGGVGGNGGFGGGGGGGGPRAIIDPPTGPTAGGLGGFGAGNGGSGAGVNGNGGSALGGAIFVQQGGTLTIIDGNLAGSGLAAGTGAANGGTSGPGIYLNNINLNFLTQTTSTIADGISGAGNVTKNGPGSLFLSGFNTYAGSTTVNQGELVLNGAILGSTTVNQGELVLNGAISGSATLNQGEMIVNGAVAGSATVNQGELIVNGAIAGSTTLNQGILTVNGSIGGPVLINNGGTFNGVGQVGPTVVNGIIAPGNPAAPLNFTGIHVQPSPSGNNGSTFGTLTINGSYTQNAGSTYQVKIDPSGQSDLIQVNGKAQINGGIIQVLASNGGYQLDQIFTILRATGGVAGTFNSTSGIVPGFFGVTPIYGPNTVAIEIMSSYQSVATSFNQASIARYLDTLSNTGSIPPALNSQLRSLSSDQLQNALSQLAGSPYASLLTLGRLRSLYLNQLLTDQIRPVGGFATLGIPTARGQMQDADHCDEPTDSALAGIRTWSRLYGLEGRVTDGSNPDGFRYTFSGVQLGVEKQLYETGRFGLTGTYSYTSADFNNLNSTAGGGGGLFGVYGVQSIGTAYVLASGTYGFNQFNVSRFVSFGALDSNPNSSVHQNEFNALVETGCNEQFGAWIIQPIMSLQSLSLHQANAIERATGGTSLSVAAQSTEALWFSTGLRLSRPIQDESNRLVPTVHARWVQDWHGEDHFVSGALTGAGGSYLVQGATAGRNFLITGLTLAADTGSYFRLIADYSFQTSGTQSSHTGSGGVELHW